MFDRSHRPAPERQARSQLAQLLTGQDFLLGSLVQRARSCGKPNCRCQKGQPHRSLYLATRHQGRRVLLYVPRRLEDAVRQRIDHGKRLRRQLQNLHQTQLDAWLLLKQQRQPKAPETPP